VSQNLGQPYLSQIPSQARRFLRPTVRWPSVAASDWGWRMPTDERDNVRDLSDKKFEKHAERVRKSGGIPARREGQFGGLWKADGDPFDLALRVMPDCSGRNTAATR
jgi:hypothetical protein